MGALFSSTASHVPAPYAAEDIKKYEKEKAEPETASVDGQTGSPRDTGALLIHFTSGKRHLVPLLGITCLSGEYGPPST